MNANTTATARVGNGRATHRVFSAAANGQIVTVCGAEGRQSTNSRVTLVEAPVTCGRCGGTGAHAPAPKAPVQTDADLARIAAAQTVALQDKLVQLEGWLAANPGDEYLVGAVADTRARLAGRGA